jgi:Ca2+-binding EF-hand superfamily protein
MSASSSAASSTLSRSRATVLAVTALAAFYGIYYLHSTAVQDAETTNPAAGGGLHRSNAIHRRRRRSTATRQDTTSVFADDSGENDEDAQIVARTLTDGETVVDDQGFQEEFGLMAARPNYPYQRNGQNVVQLLFRVSEDATRRNAYVHRGCACNGCGVVPIRGIRYRCANCADYDLCEGCESQGLHIKTHIFYKIRVPAPSFGPRLIQPVWYSGDPDSVMRPLPKEIIPKLSRETGFERPELEAYWEQWTFMANTDWRDDPDDINLAMDRKTFERCLVPSGGYRHGAPSLIFDRMFAFYDTNKDDLIGFPEFLHGIAYRKKKDKWIKIFEGYDIDGDGFVDRKDFLRMFRSYYVLYKQMHRDMLEGIEEQQMSSTDAHRLVNSRQPLSSAFGQDGRYPPAPDPRSGEGKTPRHNGDLEINDGKGVVNESGNDTGDREDIFTRDFPRRSRNSWDRTRYRNSGGYWDTMINPPETIEEIPDILRNLTNIRRQSEDVVYSLRSSNAHPALQAQQVMDEQSGASSYSSIRSIEDPENDEIWPPNYVNVTDEDAEAIDGPGTRVAEVRRSRRRAVISHAIHRERSQRDIYERWKRRQFYTDEEEGATPPTDWKEDDDVLAHDRMNGESSKTPSRPSAHSRSSSKVRFAEDMDDFDTRSNPSTSSRSVPERWGGIEIPDAEKDAGKEILYQVTQQAFNELLDPLFKAKEDLAVDAAMTRTERERYRHLYTDPEFEGWAYEKETQDEVQKQAEKEKKQRDAMKREVVRRREDYIPTPVWPDIPEVEVEEVRQRELEELLAATGYRVEENATTDGNEGYLDQWDYRRPSDHNEEPESPLTSPPLAQPRRESSTRVSHITLNSQEISETPSQNSQLQNQPTHPPTSPTEVLSIIAQYDDDRDSSSLSPQSTSPRATPPSPASSYRDPTLPQNRPNSLPADPVPNTQPEPNSTGNIAEHGKATIQGDEGPDKEVLYKLWKCDRAEKEKERKGGWGRLDFEEFEVLVKEFVREGRGNQMDYLGSWIEFCIP